MTGQAAGAATEVLVGPGGGKGAWRRSRALPVVAAGAAWLVDALLLAGSGLEDPLIEWGRADLVRWELVSAVLFGVTLALAASSVPLANVWGGASLIVLLVGSDLLWPSYFGTPMPVLAQALIGAWSACVAAFVLRFPGPRLTRAHRAWVIGVLVVMVPLNVVVLLAVDPAWYGNAVYADAWWTFGWPPDVHDQLLAPAMAVADVAVLAGTLVLQLRRYRRARGSARAGLLATTAGLGLVLALDVPSGVTTVAVPWLPEDGPQPWWFSVALAGAQAWMLAPAVLALSALVELAGRRRAAALVAEEVVGVAAVDGPGPSLDAAVRRCLGDPTAAVVTNDGDGARLVLDAGAGWSGDGVLVAAVEDAVAVGLRHCSLVARRRASVVDLAASRIRVVEAASEERRAVERDLHDGAQQAVLGLSAVLARADLLPDEELPALVAQALERLDGIDSDLIRLLSGLQPAELALGGLGRALPALAAGVDLDVRLTLPDSADPLPRGVEAAVYFVVAEAVANAVKHSGAHVVEVSVATSGQGVLVQVSDDGVGGAVMSPRGGLAGLAERVGDLDGVLDVRDRPGGGCIVSAEIPQRAAAGPVDEQVGSVRR